MINSLRHQANNLVRKSNNSSNKEMKCWDCGKLDVKKRHQGCKAFRKAYHTSDHIKNKQSNNNNNRNNNNNNNKKKFVLPSRPKKGEPETFTFNNEE